MDVIDVVTLNLKKYNFSTNKYQLGLHNLDFSYSHHSSILLLNSLSLSIFSFIFIDLLDS